jgi:hypothetical protein
MVTERKSLTPMWAALVATMTRIQARPQNKTVSASSLAETVPLTREDQLHGHPAG